MRSTINTLRTKPAQGLLSLLAALFILFQFTLNDSGTQETVMEPLDVTAYPLPSDGRLVEEQVYAMPLPEEAPWIIDEYSGEIWIASPESMLDMLYLLRWPEDAIRLEASHV